MDKFINAFSRTPHKKDDEGRSHQFAKRLATSTSIPFLSEIIPGPILPSSELSPMENKVYAAWWDQLDPFGLGVVVDEALHPFLLASNLDQDILQQIIDFYAGEAHYLEDQFYAILRLVAHGQSGRKINRDLVVLGAPLAIFNPDTLKCLFNQDNSIKTTDHSNDNRNNARNTWWGQTLSSQKVSPGASLFGTTGQQEDHLPHQQPSQSQSFALTPSNNHRHSYAGSTLSTSAFLSPTQPPPPMPTVNAVETQCQPSWAAIPQNSTLAHSSTPMMSASEQQSYSKHNQINAFAWAEQALASSTPVAATTTNPLTTTAAVPSTSNKSLHTHSRSRSVPYASQDMPSANDFIFDTIAATQSKQDQPRPTLVTSRSSMDATAFQRLTQLEQQYIDHGQSLLLTQKFVPPSSTTKSTNPFEDDDKDDDDDDGDSNKNESEHMIDQQQHVKSPFDDNIQTEDDSNRFSGTTMAPAAAATTPRVTPEVFAFPTRAEKINLRTNKSNIPPPPVPPQSTKPAYPRYVRNQPLKRSQSQHSRPFMSQGAFLLATSSAASSVQFPSSSTVTPLDDTTRLFRHRSTTSFPHK